MQAGSLDGGQGWGKKWEKIATFQQPTGEKMPEGLICAGRVGSREPYSQHRTERMPALPHSLKETPASGLEAAYASLVNLVDEAVAITDQQWRILDANPRLRSMTGLLPEGTSFLDLLLPDDRERFTQAASRLTQSASLDIQIHFRRSDGSEARVSCAIGLLDGGSRLVVLQDLSEHHRREMELRQRNREVIALYELGRQISASFDVSQLLTALVTNTVWILECQFAGVGLLDPPTGTLTWRAISGNRITHRDDEVRTTEGDILDRAVSSRRPVVHPGINSPTYPSGVIEQEGLASAAAIPLAHRDLMYGVLLCGYRAPHSFAEEEIRFLSSLTDTIALALENTRLYLSTVENARKLKALSSRLSMVQEEERARISRELHDGVGQALTAIRFNVDLLSREANIIDPAGRGRLHEVNQIIDETLRDIRQIAFDLRPTVLDHFGLQAALRIYCARFTKQTGVPVQCIGTDDIGRWDATIEATVFRVIQEALTNVARHAQATEASVELVPADTHLELDIWDNGRGCALPRGKGDAAADGKFGILNMRERVEELHGTFAIESAPGNGTRIHVRIPRKL
jgi:PAS domain S-box-containing protein